MLEFVVNDYYASLIETQNYEDDKKYDPVYRQHVMRTAEFFDLLSRNSSTRSDILPMNCRYSEDCLDGSKIMVIEEPPSIRNIKIDLHFDTVIDELESSGRLKDYGYEDFLKKSPPYTFRLAFPYIIFILKVTKDFRATSARIFFRLHPLNSKQDYLIRSPLTNINEDCDSCLGSLPDEQSPRSWEEAIVNMQDKFWTNVFNKDYIDGYIKYNKLDTPVKNYLTWEYNTYRDPMFIYNAKWIMLDYVVGDVIKYFSENSSRSLSFNSMYNVLTGSHISPEIPQALINCCESFSIGSFESMAIGDSIMIEEKEHWVNEIESNEGSGNVQAVILENEEGARTRHVLTDEFKKICRNSLAQEKRLESIVVNDIEIKPRDIIEITKPRHEIKRIDKIRVAPDGKIEAICNNYQYLIENLEFKVFDPNDIKLGGLTLSQGKEYTIIQLNYNSYAPTCPYYHLTYDNADLVSGSLYAKFYGNDPYDGVRYDMTFTTRDDNSYVIMEGHIDIPPVPMFRYHSSIINNSPDFSISYTPYEDMIISNRHTDDGLRNRYVLDITLDHIWANKEHTAIHIPSYGNGDIDFAVGDFVVFVDWNNQESMRVVRKITEFVVSDSNILSIVGESLIDNSKESIRYINLAEGIMYLGNVRKIYAEYEGWNSGDKVKAHYAGIPHFPKKDTNEIIGFIEAPGNTYPLILFSNGLTQWGHPDVMNNFNIIKPNTPQWSKFQNAPMIQIDKIRFQAGDMVWRRDDAAGLNMITTPRWGNNNVSVARILRQGERFGYIEDWTQRRTRAHFIRHGLISPRYTVREYLGLRSKPVEPNCLNGFQVVNREAVIRIREVWDHVHSVD